MPKFLIPLAVFLCLVAVFVVGLQNDPSRIPSPLLSLPMPEFELQSLKEPQQAVSKKQMLGKPSLLNVWGSWCVNCGVEHAFLMRLAASKTINIYGLNWNDELTDARRWLLDRGDPYVFSAFDDQGRVAIDLGVYGAPETFLVDATGVIVHKHIGPLNDEIWARDFVPLIEELAAP